MTNTRLAACVAVVLALCACSSSGKSSQDGAAGVPDGGRDVPGLGGSSGGTGPGGSTGAAGSLAGTSAGGGSSLAGAHSSSSTGGGGAGGTTLTTTSAGGTTGPDAGGGTSGVRLDGGASSGSDASTPIDAPADTRQDGSVADVNTTRTETSSSDGSTSGLAFCRATSTGCQCTGVAGPEPAISACSKESLSTSGEARCCKGSAHCSCDSLACAAETSTGRCRCDFASMLSLLPPTWTKVAQCPAPASGTKCCLHAAEAYCECKQQTCASGTTEVTNCTEAQLSPCATGEQAVDTCK